MIVKDSHLKFLNQKTTHSLKNKNMDSLPDPSAVSNDDLYLYFEATFRDNNQTASCFFVSKSKFRSFGPADFFGSRQPAPDIDEKVSRTIFQLMMKLGMSLLTGARLVSVLVGAGVTLLCRG